MEIVVAVHPFVRPGNRVVHIKWTLGESCFLITFGEHTARVMYPSWEEQRQGCLFYFEWLPDSVIKAYRDPARRLVIKCNDRVAATVVALWEHLNTISYRPTYGFQIAEMHTESMSLKLVCDVFCNFFSGRFRILTGDGLRLCYWQRMGGFGRGRAKVIVSRRVDSEFLPIVIASTISMLLDSGGD